MENEVKLETKVGLIQYGMFAKGSKSESLRPFFIQNGCNSVPAIKEDDHSFDCSALKEFDGKKVRVYGFFQERTGFFEIKEISILEGGGMLK